MSGIVLILGASGRFGRHAAEAFWNKGWRVRLFDRARDTLSEAAAGADVIVNGWNPVYPDWAREVPALTAQVIDAARASGATVILPGNIYVYGRGSAGVLSSQTPHNATNPLGRIRIEMERAYRASGVRTIVLRAGDYIDTQASGNWFDAVITAKSAKGRFAAPGDANAKHAWAYLPDLARAAVELAERREAFDAFADVPFPGYTLSQNELAGLVETATGVAQKRRAFPWWTIRLASPFWKMGRHLLEMRYLWSMPHEIDGKEFRAVLPAFRETDPLIAIASAVEANVDPDETVARGAHGVAAE